MIGSEADVLVPPIGADRPQGRHGWDDAWKKLGPGAVRVALDTPWLARQLAPGAGSPLTRVISPLLEKTQAYTLTLDIAAGLTLDALATSGDADAAARVADTVRALLTLARNSVPDLRRLAEGGPPAAARPMSDLIDALDVMLETAKVEQDKSSTRLHTQADPAAVATAARLLLPAVSASREAARRAQSINNLKQIGLAMHNYHSTYDCFPPAVLYGGPDGKTPYSWRVAILPYIEQVALYSEYKFDEPWDGPNNRKLLDRMPTIFHDPSDNDAKPGVTSYFVATGPDTLFPDRKAGMMMKEITDGLTDTVMAFEAKREVLWTKPEDIAIDQDRKKPLPQFGGSHPGGFITLFADGSVRFLQQAINPIVLRALLSRAGGEIINTDAVR